MPTSGGQARRATQGGHYQSVDLLLQLKLWGFCCLFVCLFFNMWSHYVAALAVLELLMYLTDLELTEICLPLTPKSWD